MRVERYAPLSGLAVFVVFAVGNALWALDLPPTDASGQELVSFYEDRSTEIIVGAHLSLIAIALFLWFGSVLRDALDRIALGHGAGLPLTAFGGILLACAAGVGAETINLTGALRAESDAGISPSAAQSYFDISQILGFNAASVGLAVALLATGVLVLRFNALLPRWIAVAMLALAPTLLTPLSRYTFGLAFLLLPVISVAIYRHESASAASARQT